MLRPVSAALSRAIFSHRLHVGLFAVLFAGLIVHPRNIFGRFELAGQVACLFLVLAGLALRAWAGGCAGAHTRRATIEAPTLTTHGPYAHVRNPIYLASMILGLGMVGLLGDPWMLALYAAVFVFLYSAIVPAEEAHLRQVFPAQFARYCKHVPRLVPRWRAWSEASPAISRFHWPALRAEARLGLILVGIYLYLVGAAWLRR